ncbi:MAG TPA: D-alanyl-D-alanine carboxypeptidase family protein [Opitutaceae bacterium]|nr:D-alanyl-D-alanine carboxypeptidase family protein [Opitutaceae bacterium]
MFLPRFARLLIPLALCAAPLLAARDRPAVYKGAIVMDAKTGRVLFADNADVITPPASMTKLMTYAVLEDRLRSGALTLSTRIAITAADARVAAQRDSTNVALKAGESFPVEEMIYAMMIQSANDAAYAVGRFVGNGSVEAFVGMMNAKARELGMTRTTFRTPNGFPVPSHRIADGDLTTPRDFALLCRYLLLHTDILKYTSVRTRAFGAGLRMPATPMTNHNHLLGRIDGVDGLKTGFTNGAGFCLAATAKRDGERIIVVMMDCPDTRTRDLQVAALINRGFQLIPPLTLPASPVPAPGAAAGATSAPTRPDSALGGAPAIQYNPPR